MKHQNLEKLKGSGQYLSLLAIVAVLVFGASTALAATAATLGTAQSYGILGGTTVTNTGPTVVNGDLGVSPGTAVTGFPPGIVTGTIHAADAAAGKAQNDVITAYNNLTSQTCDFGPFGPTDLAGQTLVPGVYCFSSSAANTGVLTLDAGGNNNAVWVFKMGSTLDTGSGSSVVFNNGSQDCNVFWQVGSSATLGTTTDFVGNILALTSITLNTGANVSGRALARNGAVTMDSNTITPSICVAEQKGLTLNKTASPGTYDHVGQTITYSYDLKNTGNVVLNGPFNVSDDKATVTCPGTPNSLNPGESIICSASYSVIQADLDAGSITNTANATAENNAVTSNQGQVTVTKVAQGTKALTLNKTASPGTYDHVGQTITYAYELKNTGNVVLNGPFNVSDDKATVTCPGTPTSLNPGESIICSASYSVIQADLDAGSITNTANATAENNAVTSNRGQVTVTKQGSQSIPEFSIILLPVISVIGLLYLLYRRNGK